MNIESLYDGGAFYLGNDNIFEMTNLNGSNCLANGMGGLIFI